MCKVNDVDPGLEISADAKAVAVVRKVSDKMRVAGNIPLSASPQSPLTPVLAA